MTMLGRFLATGKRCGRRKDEPAGFNPLHADEPVGQFAHGLGCAAEENDFEATIGVEMDVGRGDDSFDVVVLEIGQPLADLAGVVIVDQGHDAHGVAVVVCHGFFDEGRAHQAADRFAAVGIPMIFAIMVELVEQLASDGDAEANEGSLLGHG
jgi:hypothetical protein